MQRKNTANLLFSVLLGLMGACVYTPSPMLVLDRARSQINFAPSAWQDEPVIIVDDTVIVSLSPAGNGKNLLSSVSICYLYVNKRAPHLFEDIETVEGKCVETPQTIIVKAYYPDGTIWESSSGDVSDIPLILFNEYQTDDLIHRIAVPRYTQGMVIRLEVRRTFTSPEFKSREFLREEYPIVKKRIVLTWPLTYSILHMVKNAEALSLDTQSTHDKSRAGFSVSAGPLNKILKENRLKYPEEWYAGLHFSVPPEGKQSYSWAQLSDHYLQKAGNVFQASAKITQWANSLDAGRPDSLIAQAFALEQRQVRYYANLADAHAFIPRPASVVAEKGYGDCKEMATLLKTVCGQKGVELGLALLTTEGFDQCLEAMPSLDNFNHAIVYYARGDAPVRFYDPTVYFGTAADSYFHCIGQKAFLISKGAGRIVTIEQGDGYCNSIETVSTIDDQAADGRWQMRGAIYMRGKCAYLFYPAYALKKGGEAGQFLARFLLDQFNLNTISCAVTATSSQRLEITYVADIQRHYRAIEKGGIVLAAPSIFTGDVRYTTINYEGPRYLVGFQQHDTWQVPRGFADLEKNDLATPFGRGAWSRKKGEVDRVFTQSEAVVPDEKRKELNAYFLNLRKFMKTTCWK